MSANVGNEIRALISQGMYSDILKATDADEVYRGILVSQEWLSNVLQSIQGDKIIPSKGSISGVAIAYKPFEGRHVSSWSTSMERAWEFADSPAGWTGDSDSILYAVVLSAKVTSDYRNSFIACDDGLYRLKDPAEFSREHEVLVFLNNVKVHKIDWRLAGS